MRIIDDPAPRSVKKKLEEARAELEADEVAKDNALIRFFYKKDPGRMSDAEWAKSAAEIHYVLRYTGQIAEMKGDRIQIG